MKEIVSPVRRDLQTFDPERHRLTDAALDFGIKEARRIKDWPTLEQAIDAKIAEQKKFVAWWKASVIDRGGGNVTGPRTRTGELTCGDAENITGMTKQRVSDLGRRLAKPDKYRELLLGAEYRAAMLDVVDNVRGTTGTGENEWFTPAEHIERARQVLGDIDLDPATHELAQHSVRAARYFTKEDDGLRHEWHGRVWLNPPYAQPLIAEFTGKMCVEQAAGRVTAAIMLTHNYTDTAWFQRAAACANAICFTRGRVKFYEPDGAIAAPTQGQAFFYFGGDGERFADLFSEIGFVANVIVRGKAS
jgi:phage N-6-adenine-methyltransferase